TCVRTPSPPCSTCCTRCTRKPLHTAISVASRSRRLSATTPSPPSPGSAPTASTPCAPLPACKGERQALSCKRQDEPRPSDRPGLFHGRDICPDICAAHVERGLPRLGFPSCQARMLAMLHKLFT